MVGSSKRGDFREYDVSWLSTIEVAPLRLISLMTSGFIGCSSALLPVDKCSFSKSSNGEEGLFRAWCTCTRWSGNTLEDCFAAEACFGSGALVIEGKVLEGTAGVHDFVRSTIWLECLVGSLTKLLSVVFDC